MSKDYTYEVARIRTLELSLLNSAALEQLLAARTYEEALHLLADRGYGDPDLPLTSGDLLAAEERKTWDQVMELTDDVSELKVLKLANDYHNLKAAVKLSYTGAQICQRRDARSLPAPESHTGTGVFPPAGTHGGGLCSRV